MAEGPPPQAPSFHRQLGFAALVAYGLAYIAPVAPLSTLGLVWQASGGLIALSYLLGGVCMAFTALSYALMVREIQSAGSIYGFARSVLGPFWGFVAGWQILLDYLLIPAFVYVVMAVALSQIMPGVDRAVWIVALTVFTSCVNWFGVRSTTSVSFVSVAAQVMVMILLVVVAALAQAELHGPGVSALGSAFGTAPLWRDPLPLHGVLAGTSICVMSFLGFDAVSTLAEDTADRSGRTLGRAILAVLGLATLFFVVLSWVLGNAMAGRQFHSLDAASFELAGQLAGPWAMLGLAWFYAIVVGFTNALPMQVGVARVLYAMGRDRQLPQALARLHPKHNTPHVAMLASTAVSLVVALAMRQQVEQLAAFVNFGALAGFALLHVCVLAHFARHRQRRSVLLHIVSPLLGIAVVGAVLSGMNAHALVLGLIWFCAGLALWWLRVRHTGAVITTPAG